MRSSWMTASFRRFLALTVLSGAVVVFHGASFAQQSEATPPAPAAAPAPAEATASAPQAMPVPPPQADQQVPPDYGPPPGYRRPPQYGQQPPQGDYNDYYGYPPPPPSPRYYRHPRYYPAPAPSYPMGGYPTPTSYRTVYFGFGLGVGGVAVLPHDQGQLDSYGYPIENASRAGLSYNLRLGFGIAPRWSLLFSADGAAASFNGTDVSQTVWTIGPQVFLNHQLYLRGGIGVAHQSKTYDDGVYFYDSSDSGMATTVALGYEFMQGYHTAMALEFNGAMGWYPNKDRVGTMGLNFVLNLF